MSTYLFNKRDRETNKLMGLVIFLLLFLVFTIVVGVSVFLVYFDDYRSIQEQYTILEEKLQKVSMENYEKNSDYTRLNVELNQARNEVNKLNIEKEVSSDNLKLVNNFINFVNSGHLEESNKFLDKNVDVEQLLEGNKKFPEEILSSGNFILNDNLKTGTVTYFNSNEGSKPEKYVFDLVLKGENWVISDIDFSTNMEGNEPLLN